MSRRPFATVWVVASFAGTLLFGPEVVAGEDLSAATATVAASGSASWSLRLAPDERVVYRGMVSFDGAGAAGAPMMYPAPNVAGLLAAVITHGLIVEAAKKEQKNRLQESADFVLSSYRAILDTFTYRDLMRRALEKTPAGPRGKLIEAAADSGRDRLVECAPVFSLTQDQRAIVLDNAVAIVTPGAPPAAAYRSTLRVVSTASAAEDPVAYWTANDGERLKEASAQLVAESLDIAFADAAAVTTESEAVPFRTIRYREGAGEKIERAQVLSNRCGRMVIRTLRSSLMSVPVAPTAAAADSCGPGVVSAN